MRPPRHLPGMQTNASPSLLSVSLSSSRSLSPGRLASRSTPGTSWVIPVVAHPCAPGHLLPGPCGAWDTLPPGLHADTPPVPAASWARWLPATSPWSSSSSTTCRQRAWARLSPPSPPGSRVSPASLPPCPLWGHLAPVVAWGRAGGSAGGGPGRGGSWGQHWQGGGWVAALCPSRHSNNCPFSQNH